MINVNQPLSRNIYTNYGNPAFKGQGGTNTNPTSFGGTLTESETKALTDCYISSPSESLPAAAWGGVTCALTFNPRFIVHPIQAAKSFKDVKPMFADVLKEGTTLNKLWVNPETNSAMREAYGEMHRAFSRSKRKMGLFRKQYSKETIDELQKIMDKALKDVEGKSPEEARKILVTATETLRSGYVSNGPLRFIARFFEKISGGTPAKTTAEGIANTSYIDSKVGESLKHSSTSFKKAMKTHAGIGGIVFFAGIEFAAGLGNIRTAFEKDRENKENGVKTNYGMKQLGQTLVKGMGSGLGWGVGEAIGNWSFAKWGTKIGTKINPAIGAGVGGVIGLVGASIGTMILGRITKKMVGDDIGEKIKAEALTQTPEGQAQLLQGVYEKAKKGEASPEAQAALQKVLVQMHA